MNGMNRAIPETVVSDLQDADFDQEGDAQSVTIEWKDGRREWMVGFTRDWERYVVTSRAAKSNPDIWTTDEHWHGNP